MLCIHETYLVYKLQTFKNCTEVKNIKIMIIAIIYIIFLSDISSTVENYFQKILSCPPEKIHSPLFTYSPSKNSKCASPPFWQHWKIVCLSPLQKEGENTVITTEKFLGEDTMSFGNNSKFKADGWTGPNLTWRGNTISVKTKRCHQTTKTICIIRPSANKYRHN